MTNRRARKASGVLGAQSVSTLLVLFVAALASWWGLAFASQRSVLFPGTSRQAPDPAALQRAIPELESLWVELPDARVEVWLLPPVPSRTEPAPLVIFAHGNGELIDDWPQAFATPRSWGLAVALVEFPGYGRSTGAPGEDTVRRSIVAAHDLLVARPEIDADRVVGYGRSLGGGALCALARERTLSALVLESAFTSVASMARGFGVPGVLVRDRFDNLALVREFEGPVLVVHGERDTIIPVRHGRELHAAAARSEALWLPCGHNDCPRPWPRLRRFLEDHELLDPER